MQEWLNIADPRRSSNQPPSKGKKSGQRSSRDHSRRQADLPLPQQESDVPPTPLQRFPSPQETRAHRQQLASGSSTPRPVPSSSIPGPISQLLPQYSRCPTPPIVATPPTVQPSLWSLPSEGPPGGFEVEAPVEEQVEQLSSPSSAGFASSQSRPQSPPRERTKRGYGVPSPSESSESELFPEQQLSPPSPTLPFHHDTSVPSPPSLELALLGLVVSNPPTGSTKPAATSSTSPAVTTIPAGAPSSQTQQQLPQQTMTIQRFNGTDYDLDDNAAVQWLITAMAGTVANQANNLQTAQNTINTLQLAQPIQLTGAQLNQLVGAGGQCPQQPQAINVVNPITTARARVLNANAPDVMYEEQTPEGMKDSKTIKDARAWNGTKEDLEPFIVCLKGYFKSRPNAMRFTRNKILYALDLLDDHTSQTWASLVRKAIAEDKDNKYYFDNWDEFQPELIKLFGLRHKAQNFFIRLVSYRISENKDLKDSLTYFDYLREEAKIDKDQAYFYLQQATADSL